MKAKIDIEIFDHSSLQQCEEAGFGIKDLETMYKISFESLLKELCADDRVAYMLSIEVEDNTVK